MLVGRLPLRRIVEGAAIGIALWCMILAFQLLPGDTADVQGVLGFALAGIGIRVSRLGKFLLPVLAVVAALILVVTETPLTGGLAARWIRCDAMPDSGVGAAIVLSASVNPNNTMSGEALDHLITGLELARVGKTPLIVTTTVQRVFPTGLVSTETDQTRIFDLLGKEVRWIRTPPGRSTRDEAVTASRLLLPQGITRVAVVASQMHTSRACSAFEAVGFVVTCVPARSRAPSGASSGSQPRDRLIMFGEWVYEVAGTAKYRMKGWLAPNARKSGDKPSQDGNPAEAVAPARHTWCNEPELVE